MPQSSLRSISNDYARLNGSDYGHRTGSETEGGSGAARPCKDKAALNLVQPGSVHRDYRARLASTPKTPFPRPMAFYGEVRIPRRNEINRAQSRSNYEPSYARMRAIAIEGFE